MGNSTVFLMGWGRRNKGKYRPFADMFKPNAKGKLRSFSHAITGAMKRKTLNEYQGGKVANR